MFYYVILIFVPFLILFIKRRIKYHKEVVPKCTLKNFHLFSGVKRNDLFKVMKKISDDYGPLYRTWARNSPEMNIMKSEYFKVVMKSSALITKGEIYDFLFPWLGDGLLISTGLKWFQRRKMITPAFHFKILEHYMEVFVEKSKQLVNILQDQSKGKVADIYLYITHCALDIICETAMGVSVNVMSDVTENGSVDSLCRASELIIRRRLTPWYSSEPRKCIGQKFAMYEEKTMLSAILMSYKITTIDSESTVNELAEVIMRPEQRVRIRLEKRIK